MREGFREIVDGWELDDRDALNERIHRAVVWTATPESDERGIVLLMIERHVMTEPDDEIEIIDDIVGGYLRRAGIES